MARTLDWIEGLAIVAREPLSGPRTVGAASSESVGGYVQTTASAFGLWRWQLAFRGMWHTLFRQYRGLATALHGGANALRVPFCDPDLYFSDTGVVTSAAEIAAGKPWETLAAAAIPGADGTILTLGAVAWPENAFDGVTSNSNSVAAMGAGGGSAPTYALGKSFAPDVRLFGMTVYPSPMGGLATVPSAMVTLSLYGKTGAAPASPTDGTLLGQVTAAGSATAAIAIPASDQATAFTHAWLAPAADTTVGINVAELVLQGLAPARAPWEDTRRNWRVSNRWAGVTAAAAKGSDIIQLDTTSWGGTLAGGEWLGFVPYHLGLYIVTEIFPLQAGRYRIWPPLRKALSVTDQVTLAPVMAMRLENEQAATAGRGLALCADAAMTLIEIEDADVRAFFADPRAATVVTAAQLPALPEAEAALADAPS